LVSGVQLAALLGPVLGAASGYGAEALLRRPGRTAKCRRLVSLTVLAAALVVVTAWRVAGAGPWWQAAVLVLAVVAVPLSAVDLAEQRIPDLVLGPAFALGLLLLALDAATGHHGSGLVRALLAAAALYGGALVLLVAARDSLGYGDVKALAYQGLYTGYLGWGRVLTGLLLTFTAAALTALALTTAHGREGSRRLAFAPYLLGATLTVVLLHH
jgi:leader peptidase (prepilin peptidase) / N-methyltransferase